MIKRYFFTGIVLLFPLVITIVIVSFLINMFTKPFMSIVGNVLTHMGLFNKPFLFLNAAQVSLLISKTLILGMIILVTVLTGLLAKIFFTHYLIRMGEYVLHRIPIINKIYKASQDVVKTVFAKDQQTFSQVVLVPFPHDGAYSIGMITNELLKTNENDKKEDLISVFLPGTPNPTMGFMLLFRRKQLIFVDMKIDDAVKAIISCGVTISSFTATQTQAEHL